MLHFGPRDAGRERLRAARDDDRRPEGVRPERESRDEAGWRRASGSRTTPTDRSASTSPSDGRARLQSRQSPHGRRVSITPIIHRNDRIKHRTSSPSRPGTRAAERTVLTRLREGSSPSGSTQTPRTARRRAPWCVTATGRRDRAPCAPRAAHRSLTTRRDERTTSPRPRVASLALRVRERARVDGLDNGGVAQRLSSWLLTSSTWVRIPRPSPSFAARLQGQSCRTRRLGIWRSGLRAWLKTRRYRFDSGVSHCRYVRGEHAPRTLAPESGPSG